MTLSLDADVAARIEEAAGENVSAWVNALARRELLASDYARAGAARSEAGVDGELRLAAHAARRAAARAEAGDRLAGGSGEASGAP